MDIQGQGHENVRPRRTSIRCLCTSDKERKKQGSIINILLQENRARARAYVYIRQLIQSGRKRRATLVRWIYITIDRQRKILDIRVFGNRRVTCTYVFLNKHSLTVSSDHVKVTILGCIMRELRQIFLCLPVINCFNISYRRLCERESSIVACIL